MLAKEEWIFIMNTLKKLLCYTIILLVLGSMPFALANQPDDDSTVILYTLDSPIMTVNGEQRQIDAEGSVAFAERGRTFVPLRATFELFSIELDFNRGVITGTQGNTVIRLTLGNRIAYVNNRQIILDVAPFAINGRTMVPVRFIAESLGANVEWIQSTQTVHISYSPLYVQLGNARLSIGDSQEKVNDILGKPDRIDPSHLGFAWHVYNSDYSRFIMVGILNGNVEVLYTNSRGFISNNVKYGDTPGSTDSHPRTIVYYDSNAGGIAHAVLIVSPNIENWRFTGDLRSTFIDAQNRQIFDMTNAFRVNYRKSVLSWNDTAASTARKHSQDMATRNYFDHIGLDGSQPWDRFTREGGRWTSVGENLAGGFYLGIDAFDGWVNSPPHREGMLENFRFLGVGFGHNASSNYIWYYTQLFYSP